MPVPRQRGVPIGALDMRTVSIPQSFMLMDAFDEQKKLSREGLNTSSEFHLAAVGGPHVSSQWVLHLERLLMIPP